MTQTSTCKDQDMTKILHGVGERLKDGSRSAVGPANNAHYIPLIVAKLPTQSVP